MLNNKLNELTKRTAKIIDKFIYVTDEEIKHVEQSLNITLPEDFKILNKYCSYEKFKFFDSFNFGDDDFGGVIYETIWYRENRNLPHEYVLLSEDDTDALMLKTIDDKNSQVIWCDRYDFHNICEGLPMVKPTIFKSFTDFYEFLLDEEDEDNLE